MNDTLPCITWCCLLNATLSAQLSHKALEGKNHIL